MITASLELSKELYELSGWTGDNQWYYTDGHVYRDFGTGPYPRDCPAYDLGYLLRKLPGEFMAFANGRDNQWYMNLTLMDIRGPGLQSSFNGAGESIENAACQLCIELFKAGVLTKEGTK